MIYKSFNSINPQNQQQHALMKADVDLIDQFIRSESTFFSHHLFQQLSYFKQLLLLWENISTIYSSSHFICRGSHTHTNPHPFSSPPLIHCTHMHTRENAIRFPVPAAHETLPLPASARCGGKKMFSNILHVPLFISILCRMSLTACKLIYNAVFSWVGWEGGGLGMGAGPVCDVVAAMKTYTLKGRFDWDNFHPQLPWLQGGKV